MNLVLYIKLIYNTILLYNNITRNIHQNINNNNMTSQNTTPKNNTGLSGSITKYMIPSLSDQDYIKTGMVEPSIHNEGFEYLVVLDGHGYGVIINRIKKLSTDNWVNIMNSSDEIEALKNMINYYKPKIFKTSNVQLFFHLSCFAPFVHSSIT